MSDLLHPNDEAARIWRAVSQTEWRNTLAALPEKATVNGIGWPYRETVRDRLRLAFKNMHSGIVIAGMSKAEFQADVVRVLPTKNEGAGDAED